MNHESNSFLISLIFHVCFISFLFFIYYKLNISNKYFTVVNKGEAFSINVVSDPLEKNNNNQISISTKTNHKHTLNYPLSENANVSIAKKLSKKVNIDKKEVNTGSGGKDGRNAEVIPVTKNNNIINFIPPVYPKSCLALGQEGTVVVRVLVTNEGKIIENKIHKSSGYKFLDHAVIKASSLWTVNTPPLKMSWVEIMINFIID